MRSSSIAFICRYDSFTAKALRLADLFLSRSWVVNFYIVDVKLLPDKLLGELRSREKEGLFHLYNGYPTKLSESVVCLALTGLYIKKLIARIRGEYDVTSMPVIITFFPGLCYQKRYESFSVRSLCDLILFNNEYEYGEYLNFASQFNLQNAGFVAGFHSNANDEKDCTVSSNDFIFSEQVAVPNTITERLYLAAKLVEFSNSIRGSGVLYVKPRISVRERTLFRPKLHIVDAIKCVDKPKSDNLIITYESVHKHVQCGASSITVSSTAGVEALEFHSRSYFISDFGPLEQHGGDYFIDSGTYITFQDMINGVRGAVRPEWIATRYQLFDVDGFFSRIDKLINTNERIGLNNSHKLFSAELLLKSPRTHLSVLSYFRKILRYFWV